MATSPSCVTSTMRWVTRESVPVGTETTWPFSREAASTRWEIARAPVLIVGDIEPDWNTSGRRPNSADPTVRRMQTTPSTAPPVSRPWRAHHVTCWSRAFTTGPRYP